MTSKYKVFCDSKLYYLIGVQKCDLCGEDIDEPSCFLINDWSRKGEHRQTLMHFFCKDKYVKHPLLFRQVRSIVVFVKSRPVGSFLVTFKPPAVVSGRGDMTTDFIEIANRPSEYVRDNTKYAYSESLEGAVVGAGQVESKLEDEKRIEQDPDAFLLEMQILGKKSAKELEERKKKLLEEGGDV